MNLYFLFIPPLFSFVVDNDPSKLDIRSNAMSEIHHLIDYTRKKLYIKSLKHNHVQYNLILKQKDKKQPF